VSPYARFFSQRSTDESFKNSSARQYLFCCLLGAFFVLDTAIPATRGPTVASRSSRRRLHRNARPPAPMTMNTVFVAHEIVHSVWRHWPKLPRAGLRRVGEDDAQSHHRAKSRWQLVGHVPWHAMGTQARPQSEMAPADGTPDFAGWARSAISNSTSRYTQCVTAAGITRRCCGPGHAAWRYGRALRGDVLVPCTWSFRAEGLDTPSGYGVEGEEPGPSVNNGFNQ